MQCRWRPLSALLLHTLSRRTLATHAPIVLRPYQELCLASCTDALARGSTRIGVSLPTGSGKTTVFVSLLARIAPPAARADATRALIVVNSVELARQAAAQVRRMFPHWVVEIEQGAKHQATGRADVTVATYQTLNNEQRLMKFDSTRIKAIIIDEAHHAAAPSYRRLLSRFDPDIKHPDGLAVDKPPHKIPIIGFSATFSRHDGIALGAVFERIVYHRDFLEMIKEQWLCDIRFTSVKAKLDLAKVQLNSVTKDFSTASLGTVMNSESMNNLVVRSWIDRASKRKSTLVFCVNIAHVKELTKTFRSYGIDARYIFASTPPAERKELVDAFKNGDFPVLINCAILTEGADIPNIDCVVLARPTRSRNVFAQMVGRGMRLSPSTGKTDCRIIDFVDSQSRVGGVVSLPNLFGLDPSEIDVDDETLESLKKRIAARAAAKAAGAPPSSSAVAAAPAPLSLAALPNPFSVTYTDHDDPFALAADFAGAAQPMASPYAWVHCGAGIWVLELNMRGFIRVEPDDGAAPTPRDRRAVEEAREAVEQTDAAAGYEAGAGAGDAGPLYKARYSPANFTPGVRSPYLASRVLFAGLPLAPTIRACDSFVLNKVFKKGSASVLNTDAAWRKLPASPAQRLLIIKKRQSDPEYADSPDLPPLTKGQAAVIITRLKHGAAGRYKKKKKAESQALKKTRKEEMRVERETVSVGPLVNV